MTSPYVTLRTHETQLVLEAQVGARPRVVYWGPVLAGASAAELALLATGQQVHGGPDVDVTASLSNELGAGVSGAAGFLAHRNGRDWGAVFRVRRVEALGEAACRIHCADAACGLEVVYELRLDGVSHVLEAQTAVTNGGADGLCLDWCAALCLPLDPRLSRLIGFTGRWANEFVCEEIGAFRGSYVRENKSGRTSQDTFPGLLALAAGTGETDGAAAGFHLGWSGNHRLRVDRHLEGRAFVQMGEMLLPGEVILSAGETYRTPVLYAAWSEAGLNGVSQAFHAHLRGAVMDGRARGKPRPVHYNTWEAVYFDHSPDKLIALAQRAAAIGVERFVLDDGWFGSRRSSASGLGDWQVSREVYPSGLGPLVAAVRDLGMEFGIWFEPEMVNPESELYRAHPDWVLAIEGEAQVPFRHQYVLDLTRAEVCDYLFEQMRSVIAAYHVDYVKWDMNRDLHHPGSFGRAAVHRQTRAVYALMARLRAAFPGLEIESCSSGGARADFGVLAHTDRIWTSDNNDAACRQAIQRGASYFFPLSVMGAHVGPSHCHITKRVFSMDYRAATALFGHMGLELNLLEEPERDLETLAAAIGLYKAQRDLLHEGVFYRVDTSADMNVVAVVAPDRTRALVSCAMTGWQATSLPERVRFAGLDRGRRYRVRQVWPRGPVSITGPSIVEAMDLLGAGCVVSGEALMRHGMQMPVMYPDTAMILELVAQGV